jgi:hypothetical protein
MLSPEVDKLGGDTEFNPSSGATDERQATAATLVSVLFSQIKVWELSPECQNIIKL